MINATDFTSTGYHGFAAMCYIPLTSIWGLLVSIVCVVYTLTRLKLHQVVKRMLLIMGIHNVCAFSLMAFSAFWIEVEGITQWGSCTLLFLPLLSALAGTWLLTALISSSR